MVKNKDLSWPIAYPQEVVKYAEGSIDFFNIILYSENYFIHVCVTVFNLN